MAALDRELFERLRAVGLRKEIAKPLSVAGADARKKSIRAARAAIAELRALADEIERRLPGDQAQRRTAPSPGRRTRSSRRRAGSRHSPAPTAPRSSRRLPRVR